MPRQESARPETDYRSSSVALVSVVGAHTPALRRSSPHGVHVLDIVSTAIDEQPAPSKPWPVEMRVIVFLEPIVAQAESLTSQVAADMRVVGPPTWASTPGWLKGMDEPGAITIFCTVLADDASDARSVADDVFE